MSHSDSLRLIKVNNLTLSVFAPGEGFGDSTRRVQGRFRHCGVDYWIRVTDIKCEREYVGRPDGEYSVGQAYLTISLGEPYGEYAYKLIAAVITP